MSDGIPIVKSALDIVNSLIQLGVDHGQIKVLKEKLELLDGTLVLMQKVIEDYEEEVKELKEKLK